MYQSFGCPWLSVEEITREYRSLFYESYPQTVKLYPGAAEILRELTARQNVIVGIVSGEQCHHIETMLGKHDIVCDFVKGNQMHGKAQTIRDCVRAYDLPPWHTFYADDIARGIRCGKEAGVVTVGWAGAHREKREQLEAAGADHVLSEYDEFWKLIRRHL